MADLDALTEASHPTGSQSPSTEMPESKDPAAEGAAAPEPSAKESSADEPPTGKPESTGEPCIEVRADQASSAEPTFPVWRRRPSRWAAQVAALSLAILVLLAVSALLFQRQQRTPSDTGRHDVVNVAEAVARELSTIGAGNAAQHMEALTKLSTGDFHDQLGGYSPMFQKILQAGNVNSKGTVTAVGIERLDADGATVLVALSAMVTSSQAPAGQLRDYRLAVQLERSGSQWLASKVDYVG